ncbi:hypothetical protein BACT_0278 [Bifidobacterium actinocoloniiforme DSM 22766]|uniref:Uncharacterized protein n=1 Tax=Bifidobacterium actinocoloniiforme DSM 22766 TaxID=1437605 RepID=A0A086YYU6_9BIFI|nr:hypothetical protein BACT_0278 [Bifidobacterium actinocoloniiforme DSM 22766]
MIDPKACGPAHPKMGRTAPHPITITVSARPTHTSQRRTHTPGTDRISANHRQLRQPESQGSNLDCVLNCKGLSYLLRE